MASVIPDQILHLLRSPAERSGTPTPVRIDGYEWSVSTDERDGDFVVISVEVHLPLLLKEWFVLLLSPSTSDRGDSIACAMDPIRRKARMSARIREDSDEPTKVQIAGAVHGRAYMLLRMANHGEHDHERLVLRRHHRLGEDMLTCLNTLPDPGEPASQENLLHLTKRLMAALPGRKVTQQSLSMYAAGMLDPVVLADIEHLLDLQVDTLHFAGGTAAALPIQEISDKDAEEDGGTWKHRRTTTHEEIQRFWRYHDPQVILPVPLGSEYSPVTSAVSETRRDDDSFMASCLPVGDHSTDDATPSLSLEVNLHTKTRTSANFPITFSNRLPRF